MRPGFSHPPERLLRVIPGTAASLVLIPALARADAGPGPGVGLDTVWVLFAGSLVFLMNAGFGLLESGLCRARNTVSLLAENFVVVAAASLSFYAIGFGLMFGNGAGLFGTEGLFALGGADNSPAVGERYEGAYRAISWAAVPLHAKFFFQLALATVAATIVSGAVAERIRFRAYLLFAFALVAFVYPLAGHWVWGGGWLAALGMWDFAGSTVVHSVGGWAGLAGALLLGPRRGKYGKAGRVNPIPGHNMTSVFLGSFLLWLGWFGFNPGAAMGVGDGSVIARVLVVTNVSASAGTLAALVTAWVLLGKPDFTMIVNGSLAGLVAITASCAFVTLPAAVAIGLVAGVLVVLSVLLFDRFRIDDPVGALSVHLVNGIWGTLAVALFASRGLEPTVLEAGRGALFLAQLVGVVAVGAFSFGVSLLLWSILRSFVGLRVDPEEELEGLDGGEHGNLAYPDFQPGHVGGRGI